MEILDLMTEIEEFCNEKGLDKRKTTVSDLINKMAIAFSEEDY